MIKYVGQSADKRRFLVSKKNLGIIPAGWKVHTGRDAAIYYNQKTGKPNISYEGLKELKTRADVDAFRAVNEKNIDVLFGYFKERL